LRVMSRAEHARTPHDGDLEDLDLVQSWIHSPRNLSPRRSFTCNEIATQLVTHARVHAGVVDACELRRKHVEEFLGRAGGCAPASDGVGAFPCAPAVLRLAD